MCGIYFIENTKNGKRYIGQSRDIKYRLWRHKRDLIRGCHQNSHLQRSWNKYGGDCFHFSCLESCPESDLNFLEEKYIAEMETTDPNNGYNKESGGKAHRVISEETRRKMSEAKKGMYDGEKNPMYGISLPVSKERREHLSKMYSGKGNPMYGRKVEKSPEVRRMFSEMFTGEGNPFYGKTHTDETKERMRRNNKKKRAVRCVETGHVYDSSAEAHRKTGIFMDSISKCCNKKQHTAGGYHWEFVV